MTREPAEVQAVARLLSEGVVIACTQCGALEATTTDGRRRHEQLHGHQLSGTDNRKEARP